VTNTTTPRCCDGSGRPSRSDRQLYFRPRDWHEGVHGGAKLLIASAIFERRAEHTAYDYAANPAPKEKEDHRPHQTRAADLYDSRSAERRMGARIGKAPQIYSREINYWLFSASVDIAQSPRYRPPYIHTTAYPDANVAAGSAGIRGTPGGAEACSPSSPADGPRRDHTFSPQTRMNFKTRVCCDLEKAWSTRTTVRYRDFRREGPNTLTINQGMGGTGVGSICAGPRRGRVRPC